MLRQLHPYELALVKTLHFYPRKYSRSTHNNPLTRKTGATCLVYAPLEDKYHPNDKYFWKDVPCDVKAPFICKYNPDLLGFHKLSNLVLDKSMDIRLASMSLTTCLAICKAQTDTTHIAFILEDRCICAKGTAKIIPIFFRKT